VADGLFDCDDANVCTADVCVPGVGCEYSPQSGECEGGLCVEGVCCVPNCTEKDCGGDGCGGTCGACEDEELCLDPPGRCFADLTDAMVAIAPGTFTMGCEPALDPNCKGDEKPAHTVTLSPYWIDAVEVTVARYQECVEAESCTPAHSNLGGCLGNTEKLEYPVNCIEWDQAADYCAFVEKRLCTEAEWEKAARGTEMRTFPWGEQPASCAYAVMKEVLLGCGLNGPGPIASVLEASSPYGVLDMAGNVSEWVGDYYSSAYYLGSPASDPKGPSVGATRSHRGGSFISTSVGLRTSARNYLQPDGYGTDVGFRCCQDY